LIAANGRLPSDSSRGQPPRSPPACRRARVRQGRAFGGAEEAPSLTAAARGGDGNMRSGRKNARRRGSNKRMGMIKEDKNGVIPLDKDSPIQAGWHGRSPQAGCPSGQRTGDSRGRGRMRIGSSAMSAASSICPRLKSTSHAGLLTRTPLSAGNIWPSAAVSCRVRDLFVTGPGPDAGGSKPGNEGWAHMPERSGIDAVPCLDCCANATDESRVVVAVVEIMNFRIMISPVGKGRAQKKGRRPWICQDFGTPPWQLIIERYASSRSSERAH